MGKWLHITFGALFNLQVQCVRAFLVFAMSVLDFCIIHLKTVIPLLSSLLMSSLALIDDEKKASVFQLFPSVECIRPHPVCLGF